MRYAAVETVRVELFKGGTVCTRSASVKLCLESRSRGETRLRVAIVAAEMTEDLPGLGSEVVPWSTIYRRFKSSQIHTQG